MDHVLSITIAPETKGGWCGMSLITINAQQGLVIFRRCYALFKLWNGE